MTDRMKLNNSSSPPNYPRVPAALFALAPGGSLGARRKSLVEVKAAISSLVIPLEPGAILLKGTEVTQLRDFDHLTIHDDLMAHIQGQKEAMLLLPSSIVNGELSDDAIHLVTISAAPSGVTSPYSPRSQRHYEGGIPVFPFAPDKQYDPRRTHLIIDIWASRPWFEAPAFLPPIQTEARIALSYSGCAAWGPVHPEWAFRQGEKPPCVFHFRFWYAEIDAANGAPFISAGGTSLQIQRES